MSDREIADFIDALLKSREQESVVYFIGNGGSASTASHFVNDWHKELEYLRME